LLKGGGRKIQKKVGGGKVNRHGPQSRTAREITGGCLTFSSGFAFASEKKIKTGGGGGGVGGVFVFFVFVGEGGSHKGSP